MAPRHPSGPIVRHAPRRPFPPSFFLPAPPRAGPCAPRGSSRRLGARGPVAAAPARRRTRPPRRCRPGVPAASLRSGAAAGRARAMVLAAETAHRVADAADRGRRALSAADSALASACFPGYREPKGGSRFRSGWRRRSRRSRPAPLRACPSPPPGSSIAPPVPVDSPPADVPRLGLAPRPRPMLALNLAPLFTFGEVLRRIGAILSIDGEELARSGVRVARHLAAGLAGVPGGAGSPPGGSRSRWMTATTRSRPCASAGADDLAAAPERGPGGRHRHRGAAHLQRLHRHRPDPGGRRHPRPGRVVRRPEPGQGRASPASSSCSRTSSPSAT